MLVAQSPISGHHRRKPLQPRNSSPSPLDAKPKPKPNPNPVWGEVDENNKENIYSTPVKKQSFQMELLDASLAEELSAIREKMERLRVDRDRTEKMLRERALLLDSHMKEIVDRGMLQKQLEIEVDRLFRLKEIKLSCTSVSPLRSLREKAQSKRMHQQQDQFKAENHSGNRDEREEESTQNSQVKTEN